MKKIQFRFETEWMSFKHWEKRDLLAPLLIHNGADVNGEKQSVDNLSPIAVDESVKHFIGNVQFCSHQVSYE